MKIAVLVLGILGVLLGFIVTGISLALPSMTNNRINFGEAMPGIIIGVLVLAISFLIAIIGIVLMFMKKKKA
jgi:hypothetical protein